MTISAKKFLFLILFSLCIFFCFYWFLFSHRIGANVKAEWWLKNVYDYKDNIANQSKSPKIIIISGSNSLFGVDSSIISKLTGYPVVNLAGHAGLDISFLFLKLEEHLRGGDIVVMPLESVYFERQKLTDWFTNNMLSWGKDDYLSKISTLSMLNFFTSVPSSNILLGLFNRNQPTPIVDDDEAISTVENLIKTEGVAWRGYTYLSLDQHGDIMSGEEVTEKVKKESKNGYSYYMKPGISDRFLTYYTKIEKLTKDRQAKLILTWSVMMKNKSFNLSNEETKKQINKFLFDLDEKSIRLYCDPALFQYDVDFFFDTEFHLNRRGTQMRSQNLGYCINQTLKGISHWRGSH